MLRVDDEIYISIRFGDLRAKTVRENGQEEYDVALVPRDRTNQEQEEVWTNLR